MNSQRVVVVGQGYVGLPLAMAACDAGYLVHGVDVNKRKVELLSRGDSYVEDVSNDLLQKHLRIGSYSVGSDFGEVDGFDIAVITVPTPLKNGAPDLSFIESAALSLAPHISGESVVILESTTYPGTTEEFLVPALESVTSLKAGEDFYVGYSPERIDPGNVSWNLLTTPKVVSGVNGLSSEKISSFYSSLGISVVAVSGTREAELSKLLENTFRHVNIALVNELAVFARQLKVNIWEAIEAASTKPFGFMKFLPGPGVGGHCLPIDPSYLSWAIEQKTGLPSRFVDLANSINENMPSYVAGRLGTILGVRGLTGARVLLVGLAYKPNTGDFRESPSLEIARILAEHGAQVWAYDSFVDAKLWPEEILCAQDFDEVPFDASVIVTNHDGVVLDKLNALEIPVLDTRNCMTGPRVEQL